MEASFPHRDVLSWSNLFIYMYKYILLFVIANLKFNLTVFGGFGGWCEVGHFVMSNSGVIMSKFGLGVDLWLILVSNFFCL